MPEYVTKYTANFERNNWSPEEFASDYSVPIRITLPVTARRAQENRIPSGARDAVKPLTPGAENRSRETPLWSVPGSNR